MVFENSSRFFATCDADHRVSLFALEPAGAVKHEWVYIGSMKSHNQPIVGLEFKQEQGKPLLVSIAGDRYMIKYDVQGSSIGSGLVLHVNVKSLNLPFLNVIVLLFV